MGKQRLPKPDPRVTKPQLKALRRNRAQNRQTKLRKSMTPGTVAVVLIGPYMSKKVVFLKQLDSGLLLCACLNNESVRRFPQKWLLATSQTVDVSKVKAALADSDFKTKKGSKESGFFEDGQKSGMSEEFTAAAAKIVGAVAKSAKKQQLMYEYLCARFTLDKEVPAHAVNL